MVAREEGGLKRVKGHPGGQGKKSRYANKLYSIGIHFCRCMHGHARHGLNYKTIFKKYLFLSEIEKIILLCPIGEKKSKLFLLISFRINIVLVLYVQEVVTLQTLVYSAK